MGRRGKKIARITAVGVLVLYLLGGGTGWADSDEDDTSPARRTHPITGTVTVHSWRGDDLFIHLDVNSDSLGDLWGKLEEETRVVDQEGRPLPLTAIAKGVELTLTRYKIKHGYYKIYRVTVGAVAASPQGRDLLQGRVTQVFRFGDRLFVGLDTTRSGQMDTRVKIKARAVVGGSRGNRLAFEAIRPGGTLTLVAYTLDQDGYYEAFHVIVGKRALPAPAQAGQPLQGKVLETIPFGDDLFIRLDANGDGQADYSVKVDQRTVIVGSPSQPMGLSTIVNGVTLRVPRYRFTNGYYEAQEVAIGSRG